MVNCRRFFSASVRTMISSIAVRKIIFLSLGGQRSLCQISVKFSPIQRILASSSEDNEHRFPSRLASRSLTVPMSSSFSFQRRSNSAAARRFLTSTASYCSNAFFASYSSCSSLLDRAARCAASPVLSSSSALRLAPTPKCEILRREEATHGCGHPTHADAGDPHLRFNAEPGNQQRSANRCAKKTEPEESIDVRQR